MKRHAMSAPLEWAYVAVGMHRALDSEIGLPRRATSASWMLAFLTPAEVRRSFMMSPWNSPRGSMSLSLDLN